MNNLEIFLVFCGFLSLVMTAISGALFYVELKDPDEKKHFDILIEQAVKFLFFAMWLGLFAVLLFVVKF